MKISSVKKAKGTARFLSHFHSEQRINAYFARQNPSPASYVSGPYHFIWDWDFFFKVKLLRLLRFCNCLANGEFFCQIFWRHSQNSTTWKYSWPTNSPLWDQDWISAWLLMKMFSETYKDHHICLRKERNKVTCRRKKIILHISKYSQPGLKLPETVIRSVLTSRGISISKNFQKE